MYEAFYRFRTRPFSLLPDPEFLFLSDRHKIGLHHLEYGLLNRAVFTVLTGEPGTGKTTLLNKLLEQRAGRCLVGVITTTHPNVSSLLPWVADAFGLGLSGQDTVGYFRAFTTFLRQAFAAGRQVLLVVDEAQNLTLHTLEELRLLSNVNDGRQNGIQIILAGQPNFRTLLTGADMRQLAQRVAVDYALEPLNEGDTRAYVRHRLSVGGGEPSLFTDYACVLLHQLSGGTPRVINQLCDLALAYGFGESAERITASLVLQVASDRAAGGILPSAVDPHTLQLDAGRLASEALQPEPLLALPSEAAPASSSVEQTRQEGNGRDHYRQGLDLKQAGHYREALKKFEAAERDPECRFKASAQRGLCWRALGRLDDAAASFRHALAGNGAHAIDVLNVRYLLARTLDTLGQAHAAQEEYHRIHRADPGYRDIGHRIASLNAMPRLPRFPLSLLQSLKQNWLQLRGSSESNDLVIK